MYTDRSLMGAINIPLTGNSDGYIGDVLDMNKTWDDFFASGMPPFFRLASTATPTAGGSVTFQLRTSDAIVGNNIGGFEIILTLPTVNRAEFGQGAEYNVCLPYCDWFNYRRYLQLYADFNGTAFAGGEFTWGLMLELPQKWRGFEAEQVRLI